MTADPTWLLVEPGRSITDRNHKDSPAPWVDVPIRNDEERDFASGFGGQFTGAPT